MSNPESPPADPIRVFISYSHDSPEHSGRVLDLAFRLRDHGIEVELDQFHQDEIVDWPRWRNEQTSRDCSDFVLCIATAEYRRRIEGKVPPEKGKGAYWEGASLDGEFQTGRCGLRTPAAASHGSGQGRKKSNWSRSRSRNPPHNLPGFASPSHPSHHRARLFRDREELAKAAELIHKHHDGRRFAELADAEEAARDW